MALGVGGGVKVGGGNLFCFGDALLDAAGDPGGFGGLQGGAIGHRAEHPQQVFTGFLVSITAADLDNLCCFP